MILGFTGSRKGWTRAQAEGIRRCVAVLPNRAVHGGAEGADELFDEFLRENGMMSEQITIYALPHRIRYWLEKIPGGLVIKERVEPLARNREIVAVCDHLLVIPATQKEILRSGTWATVRYAREAGKPRTIVFPDGSIEENG